MQSKNQISEVLSMQTHLLLIVILFIVATLAVGINCYFTGAKIWQKDSIVSGIVFPGASVANGFLAAYYYGHGALNTIGMFAFVFLGTFSLALLIGVKTATRLYLRGDTA